MTDLEKVLAEVRRLRAGPVISLGRYEHGWDHALLRIENMLTAVHTPVNNPASESCAGQQQTLVNEIPDGLVLCNDGNYAVDIGTKSPTYGWLLQRGLNKNWFTCRKAADDEIERAKAHHRIASTLCGSPVRDGA